MPVHVVAASEAPQAGQRRSEDRALLLLEKRGGDGGGALLVSKHLMPGFGDLRVPAPSGRDTCFGATAAICAVANDRCSARFKPQSLGRSAVGDSKWSSRLPSPARSPASSTCRSMASAYASTFSMTAAQRPSNSSLWVTKPAIATRSRRPPVGIIDQLVDRRRESHSVAYDASGHVDRRRRVRGGRHQAYQLGNARPDLTAATNQLKHHVLSKHAPALSLSGSTASLTSATVSTTVMMLDVSPVRRACRPQEAGREHVR